MLTILRASPHWVAVDKPSGLLSVPGKGADKADCVVARVRALFPQALGPLMVHRLDMDTSGVLLVGLDPRSQRELSAQFERREVHKEYVAVLAGRVEADEGEIDVPIRLDVDRRPYQIADFVQGKPSQTRYTVECRERGTTRVRFEPLTGRSHQIRVHAALAPVLEGGRRGGLGGPAAGAARGGAGVHRPGHGGTGPGGGAAAFLEPEGLERQRRRGREPEGDEHFGHALGIVGIEGAKVVAVDIEDAVARAVGGQERDNQLGLIAGVTGDVVFAERADIGDEDGHTVVPATAAHALEADG